MHKKKNQLFRIIASLKPTEKAYFKKFGYKQEKPDSAIISLFDLAEKQLRRQEINDALEEKLMALFAKKHPQLRYTKVKSRLLEQVLDALRDYDKKGQEVEKIYDHLAYADSLKKRNLFYDAWHVLQKAEKLAEELEMLELLVLIRRKKSYYERFAEKFKATYSGNETLEGILSDLDKLRNGIESDFAVFRILHFQKTIGLPRSESDHEKLREIQAHPSFSDDDFSQLQHSKLDLAVARCGILFSLGDAPAVLRVAENLIQSYNPGEKLRKMNASKYLTVFDCLLQAALLSLNVSLFEQYYPQFEVLRTYGEDDKNLKLGIDLYGRSIYAIVAGKPELMPELLLEFNRVKEKDFIPNYRKVSLAYYMIFGPFLSGQYAEAYEQIQWLKNNRHLSIRADIEVGVLAMECLILLEQDELSVLEYRLRAFDEFLKKKERKFEMEAALVRLLRASLNSRNKAELQEVYTRSYAEMQRIVAADPLEKAFLHAFDVLSWLESKLGPQSFLETYHHNNVREHLK